MASQLLFDISGIDLNDVVVDNDEIQAINPQCGDMKHLDRVVWVNDDNTQCLGVKDVRHDEFWVCCHIPGRPLLPGVLMIEASAQLCSILFVRKTGDRSFTGFTRCDDVIFRAQVVPGQTLYMLASEVSYSRRRIVCKVQGLVDSKLVFEAKITGMVI